MAQFVLVLYWYLYNFFPSEIVILRQVPLLFASYILNVGDCDRQNICMTLAFTCHESSISPRIEQGFNINNTQENCLHCPLSSPASISEFLCYKVYLIMKALSPPSGIFAFNHIYMFRAQGTEPFTFSNWSCPRSRGRRTLLHLVNFSCLRRNAMGTWKVISWKWATPGLTSRGHSPEKVWPSSPNLR